MNPDTGDKGDFLGHHGRVRRPPISKRGRGKALLRMQISIMPEAAGLAPRGLLALIVRDSDGLGAQAECRLKAGALGLPGKPTFDAAGAPVGMSELAATDANRNDDRPYDYQNLQLGPCWSSASVRPVEPCASAAAMWDVQRLLTASPYRAGLTQAPLLEALAAFFCARQQLSTQSQSISAPQHFP